MLKIYVAHAMTGRSRCSVIAESCRAERVAEMFRKAGIGVQLLDPVVAEDIRNEPGVINASPGDLAVFWKRDKEMIREAHVLLDLTGPRKSEGVAHEIGYARFCLWKPVIRVYPGLGANSVARFEDDVIEPTVEQAMAEALLRWGSFGKRLLWRVKMLNKSVPKWLFHQLGEIK